jgi:hypothetical protein
MFQKFSLLPSSNDWLWYLEILCYTAYIFFFFFGQCQIFFVDYLMTLSMNRLWNFEMVGWLMNWKNLGHGHGLINILYWHLNGATEEKKEEIPVSGSWCPSQDSDQAPVWLIKVESLVSNLVHFRCWDHSVNCQATTVAQKIVAIAPTSAIFHLLVHLLSIYLSLFPLLPLGA